MLIKLNKNEIMGLPEGTEEIFYVKLTRLYDPEPKQVWEGNSQLYIQRHKIKTNIRKELIDAPVVITPRAYDWAEGSYKDVFDNGDVVVEDYQMEIFQYRKSILIGAFS